MVVRSDSRPTWWRSSLKWSRGTEKTMRVSTRRHDALGSTEKECKNGLRKKTSFEGVRLERKRRKLNGRKPPLSLELDKRVVDFLTEERIARWHVMNKDLTRKALHAGFATRFLLHHSWLIALHYKSLICMRTCEKMTGPGGGGTNWAGYRVSAPPPHQFLAFQGSGRGRGQFDGRLWYTHGRIGKQH